MNTKATQAHQNQLMFVQQIGRTWRCLIASVEENAPPAILDTTIVEQESALNALIEQNDTVYVILSGSSTVCRTTTLPDVEEAQVFEALRLQAESKFLGGTPEHRRAIAALDNAVGETNRVGLIVAWPETSTIDLPNSLSDAIFIPDVGAIAALLDGVRPTEPLLYADYADGTVTIALSHANGAALRATREDSSSHHAFVEGISRVARETANSHNHTPAFTDALVGTLQTTLSHQNIEEPLLLVPDVVIDEASHRVRGIPNEESWWSTWGVLLGGLLVATGSLHTLASMKLNAPELHPSKSERFIKKCDNRSVAIKLAIAAVLLLAFGPAIISGLKLTVLDLLNPELQELHQSAVEERKQQIVYKELGKSAWPITKVVADVINNVPLGIDVDRVSVNIGEPISIRGRAINTDGKSAAELIAQMQENLQATGMFKDIQFAYDPAGTYGDREFDLWATLVQPLKRPRYTKEKDFGLWTYAMRQAGLEPEVASDFVPTTTYAGNDTGSPLNEANQESSDRVQETPAFIDDKESTSDRDRTTRPIGSSGSAGAGNFSDNPNQSSGGGARIPDPLDPAVIATMSESEARVALTDVTDGLQRVSRGDDETKKRLRNEMRLLLDRLKETQK